MFDNVKSEPSVVIIGHRGASGHRPEHTLASYELAIELGADYIEPDLVSTKDGALVARHENEISGTTDVAEHPEFLARKTKKIIDGIEMTGWFTEDFTLAELKTLRCKERLPHLRPANTAYDRQFAIPTLDEIVTLAQAKSVGIYPETKHPSYFESIGLGFDAALVDALHRHGYRSKRAPVFIQSFEVANLQRIRALTDLPLVQLMDAAGQPFDFKQSRETRTYAQLSTPRGLAEVATYADCIGVNKHMLVPRTADGVLMAPTSLVDDAHAAKLRVHAWTFRSENEFLPANYRRGSAGDSEYARMHGDAQAEYATFLALGLDGMFSDFPGAARDARQAYGRTR